MPGGIDGSLSDGAGICPDSRSYRFGTSGILTGFADLGNKLGDSYCLGFVVDTDITNGEPLFAFFRGATEVGGLLITADSIVYSIDGNSVSFVVPTTVEYMFQLCKDGDTLTLYEGCTAVDSGNFSHSPFTDADSILLLGDLSGVRFSVNAKRLVI